MTTKQSLAELKQLSRAGRENLFRRIALAAAVMKDLDWIAEVHGGSDLKAQDALQDEFFSEIGGLMTLGTLLAIYAAFPTEDKWREYRYDLNAMDILRRQQASEMPTEEKGERTPWKQIAAERAEQIDRLCGDLSRTTELATRQKTALEQAEERIRKLEAENSELRGRVSQLEKMVDRRLAA